MAAVYPTSQHYAMYRDSQWPEDNKPNFVPVPMPIEEVLHEETSSSALPVGPSISSHTRTSSVLKTEDEFSAAGQMWHDRMHDNQGQMRHFSHPQIAIMSTHGPHPTLQTSFPPPHPWTIPHSGSSTPTPIYGAADAYGNQVSYGPPRAAFGVYNQDPTSAVSMSPQSSQGGWASNNSSDGADQRNMIQSPSYRASSPVGVLRPDGIRKKNARFEIPKERNLANIDAMILASTDEGEKKELKQQKRLLRNRQAALDSRQRKKTHTEKLEHEKKLSEKKMYDLEEGFARLENQLNLEREQWLQQRQQLEHAIHTLSYDRDEAIRSKTQETAELRRQNNMLKECVRELERAQNNGYAPASDLNTFAGEYNEFGLEENWEDEFSLISGDDFLDEPEHMRRQITPKPNSSSSQDAEVKSDAGFSWNTFYMCLLFGAFIAANSNNNGTSNGTASAIASSIPAAEAGNVLKAVLQSGSEATSEVVAPQTLSMHPATVAGMRQPPSSMMQLAPSTTSASSLEALHNTLSSPSRRQEVAQAFSLSASSYNHITDPFNEHLTGDAGPVAVDPPKPSQLQQAFAAMQAEKEEMERITGLGSKIRERSLLWDQIPPQVVKDFEALVRTTGGFSANNNDDKMEH